MQPATTTETISKSEPSKSVVDLHGELVTQLLSTLALAGTPGVGRYGVANCLAWAVYALRQAALSPFSIRLSGRHRDELIAALKTAQVAVAVELAERMDPHDQLVNVRALGALIMHWSASARERRKRSDAVDEASMISEVFFHQLRAEALVEQLSARAEARNRTRAGSQ